MMINFFTADLHLGHSNIIKYCNRPFLSEPEKQMLADKIPFKPGINSTAYHDQTIIKNINARVHKHDRLWIIGDFCLADYETILNYRTQINCQDVRLIYGNHDREYGGIFTKTYQMVSINIQGQSVFMCHYPMRSWPKSHRGSWNLWGHCHGQLSDIPHHLSLDVGVDTHEYKPWSWSEVCAFMTAKKPAFDAYRNGWKAREEGGMSAEYKLE